MKGLLIGLALTCAVLVMILSFSFEDKEGKECKVETKEVVKAVYGSGRVKSWKQVLLKASVSGYVSRVLVREGDHVKRGQLLVEIDSGGLENKIKAVDEKIALFKEKLDPNSPFMRSLRSQLRIKEKNLEEARRKFLRRRDLFDKGVISRETLEEAERLFEIAKSDYEGFKNHTEDRIEELRRELASLEEEKRSLLKELDKYRIRSPIDGVALNVYVEEGDFVNQLRENDLLSLGSVRKKVVLEVDEEFLPLIKKGQKVFITTDALPNKVFEGEVKSYSLESEPTRRVVEIEVEVSLPDKIPINSVVEGNILISRFKTTVVPIRAVKDGYVRLLVGGEERKVKVRRVFDDYAEVLGFPAGTPCLF